MKLKRLREILKSLDEENISYGEIVELDTAAAEEGIEQTDKMLAVDVALELETILKNKEGKK